jgi:hypothetical protein
VRRSFVLLSLLSLIVLAGGGLTLASSSAATRSSRVIICPLRQGMIIPCCEPPVVETAAPTPAPPPIRCCPGSDLCASSLTISATPNPSTAADSVVISGQLLGATTVGVPVQLWQQAAGDAQFTQVAKATTDAEGKYKITRAARQVRTHRSWYVTAGTARSITLTQSVAAVVTLAATAGRHHATILAGHVTPSHRGERILLQRHRARGWVTIARARLSRTSSFTIRHRLGKGTAQLQAVLPADSQNMLSVSAPLTVRSH